MRDISLFSTRKRRLGLSFVIVALLFVIIFSFQVSFLSGVLFMSSFFLFLPILIPYLVLSFLLWGVIEILEFISNTIRK